MDAIEGDEIIVVKIDYVEDMKYHTRDLIVHICRVTINNRAVTFQLDYWKKNMAWLEMKLIRIS